MNYFDLTEPAEQDLLNISISIADHNEEAAIRIIDGLFERFQLIAENNEIGKNRPELREELQSFTYRRYVTFFTKTQNGVEIYRVLHEKQDIQAVFDDFVI